MKHPSVIILLGPIGAGKSYFARQLADEIGIVRLNADAIRLAMYGSVEAIREQNGFSTQANRKLWGVMNYFVRESLHRGQSVIYDTMRFNSLRARQALKKLVKPYGANIIVVWVTIDFSLAAERAQTRAAQEDQLKLSKEKVEEILRQHNSHFHPPGPDEIVVKVDGTAPFEEQFKAFYRQLREKGVQW